MEKQRKNNEKGGAEYPRTVDNYKQHNVHIMRISERKESKEQKNIWGNNR